MALALEYLQTVLGEARSLGILVLVLYVLYELSQAVYNAHFHGLANFPGPRIAAVSQIPYATALIRGKLPHWVKNLHEQYKSDVVRISPNELSFISATAWNDIHSRRTGQSSFEKDTAVYGKPINGVDSLLTANRSDHARMRRVLDHAFSDRASKEQEPVVQFYVDNLITCLHAQVKWPAAGRVDIVKWYNWMSFDIIGDLSFGESFDCIETQKYHPWVEMIFGNLKGFALLGAFNRFFISRCLLPLLIPKSLTKMIEDHWLATTEKVKRRIELSTSRPDFMSPILEHNHDGKGLSLDEIKSNSSLFVIAGSESIVTNLSGTTYHLLRNPDIMEKLKIEVRDAFQSEADITVQRVAQLPYLLACLAETNRIYPTALTGQAVKVPSEGTTISGYWVPGDTGVTINMYAAYRSQTNFKDPDTYIPERWLNNPNYQSDVKDVFQPFSVGARNCIGKSLGNMETRLAVAKMIWNFDMDLCEGTDPNWDDQQVFLSWQKKPLIIKLTPRLKKTSSI